MTGAFGGIELFQSTLPRGERLLMCSCTRCFGIFQSTLPRGERQQIRTIFNYIFNIILANLSIFLKLNFIHDVFQYQSTVFILFYKCESPCILVCASHSHKQVIESMFHPLLFPAQRQCSLFLSYTDFQDSKI